MIKITKDGDNYLIEYIDHLNPFSYIEDEDFDNIDVKDQMIRNKIKKVKSDLRKLIRDSKGLSGKKY